MAVLLVLALCTGAAGLHLGVQRQVLGKVPRTHFGMGKGFGAPAKPAFAYTGSLQPGVLGPRLEIPAHIERPDYAKDGIPKAKTSGAGVEWGGGPRICLLEPLRMTECNTPLPPKNKHETKLPFPT